MPAPLAQGKARRRAVVVCPGRGAYGRTELGSLARGPEVGLDPEVARRAAALVDAADEVRAAAGRPGIREMDGAARYQPKLHGAPENVSSLILTLSAADALRLHEFDVVAVVGNSLGWYTALHVAGALSFADTLRIVEATGAFQAEAGQVGGQVVWPLTDDRWQAKADLRQILDAAMERANLAGLARLSVDLGGSLVVAGDNPGLAGLRATLPKARRGTTEYPLRLADHSAFHTRLMAPMADHLASPAAGLSGVRFARPATTLVDGTGRQWRPLTADPEALRAYTLGDQVVTPYRFATSVRVALREFAPDVLVLLGPGGQLGGTLGQILALEGWSGIRSKDDFQIRQAGPRPVLVSA